MTDSRILHLEYRVPGQLFCWTCPRVIDENSNEWYMHRAGDGPLAHPRCEHCNDVLMRYPQPDVDEKLERVDLYLSEVTKWTGMSTVDELSNERRAVIEQVAELAGRAKVLMRQLRTRERMAAARDQFPMPMALPTDSAEVDAVFPADPGDVPPLIPQHGVVRCGVCGEPLQKMADRDGYECPTCAPLYDRDKRKGEDYRRG